MNIKLLYRLAAVALLSASCKKEGCTNEMAANYDEKAKEDNGSCEYNAPTTYAFADANGNSTVSYSGQTDRLNQLEEMTTYAKSGNSNTISASALVAMYENTAGNGGGNFSFTSSKQIKSKTYAPDAEMFVEFFDSIEVASQSYAMTASNGQAGTLTSGQSTYLFSKNGIEYAQLIEKGLMGACFYYQLTSVYLGDDKMNVDNTTAVDEAAGKYYTVMEHHFDEAFGYFGVETDFPSNTNDVRFWGKYCNSRDADLGSNTTLMNAFINGRHAITQNDNASRDAQRVIIQENMETLTAAQAVYYLEQGVSYAGSDNAKFLHVVSEAWAFVHAIKYSPVATRKMTTTDVENLIAQFGSNFWNLSTADLNSIKATLVSTYNL